MVIEIEEAKKIAFEIMARIMGQTLEFAYDEWEIYDDWTLEKEQYWVFSFCFSRGRLFHITGDFAHVFPHGIGPVLVEKDGQLAYNMGTGLSMEQFLQRHEEYREVYRKQYQESLKRRSE